MTWWLWVVAGLALLVLELLTPGVYFLFFGFAALVVGAWVGAADGVGLPAQLGVFSALSVVTLLVFRGPILRRIKARPQDGPRVDPIVGEVASARGTIPAGGHGRVELRGSVWGARNAGAAPIPDGERCRVVRVEGLTLHVEAEES